MAIAYPDSGFETQTASSSSYTKSITLSTSAKKLVVFAGGRSTISGITYNSVSLTLITASGLNYGYEYNSAYYLDNPSTGSAHNLVITYSGASTDRMISYVSISGCNTGIGAKPTPAAGINTGAQITTNITTTFNNSDILEGSWCNNDTATYTYGSGQSAVLANQTGVYFAIDKRSVTTAGSYSVSADPSGTPNNDTIVFEIPILISYTITAAYGTYTLTGQVVAFLRSLLLSLSYGSFTLTGISSVLARGYGIVADVGSYLLTGIDAILRFSGWTYKNKSTTSFTEQNKSSTTWTYKNK